MFDIDLPRLPPERVGDYQRVEQAFDTLLVLLDSHGGPEVEQLALIECADGLFEDVGQAAAGVRDALRAALDKQTYRLLTQAELGGPGSRTVQQLLWSAETVADVGAVLLGNEAVEEEDWRALCHCVRRVKEEVLDDLRPVAREACNDTLPTELLHTPMSAADLAARIGQPAKRVSRFLERYRQRHADCCLTTRPSDRRCRKPKYRYLPSSVWPALQAKLPGWRLLGGDD
jgi:hypothetical protein